MARLHLGPFVKVTSIPNRANNVFLHEVNYCSQPACVWLSPTTSTGPAGSEPCTVSPSAAPGTLFSGFREAIKLHWDFPTSIYFGSLNVLNLHQTWLRQPQLFQPIFLPLLASHSIQEWVFLLCEEKNKNELKQCLSEFCNRKTLNQVTISNTELASGLSW